jgi:two-component system CheB/CheR fusion protein
VQAPASGEFPVVGVGASAGGLEAFTELVRGLPARPDVAFVLVQHLDPKHESMLVSIISRETKLPVVEVRSGMVANPNQIYVTPPDADMEISGGVLRLLSRTQVGGRHLPIDSFFRSLAADQRTCAIGVILSGTASDGVEGLKAIKTEGGITFAQEPNSAKYADMPRNAIDSGSVDFVFSPGDIARELAKIGRNPQAALYRSSHEEEVLPAAGDGLQKIFTLLRRTTGIDFSGYKPGTINRRIARRMLLHKVDKLEAFVDLLRRDPTEVQTLCQDLLINVTSFFREPDVFEALRTTIFPRILKTKPRDVPVRIWVPGCSTGEEAYSMAICAAEFLGERGITAQIFGTDINEAAIEKARLGRYPLSIEAHVSPDRLRRFFVKSKDGYSVGDPIRKLCIFARHDLTQDPPFSNLDLISCFNVLIYLGAEAQEKAIRLLHYALRPAGFLVLGKSEAISRYQDMFSLQDRKLRIYNKQPLSHRLDYGLNIGKPHRAESNPKRPWLATPPEFDLDKEAERVILGRYSPPGFIVNDKLHILKLRGRTRPYLDPSPGEPSFNLLKMIRPELVPEVRTAIQKSRKEGANVRRSGISVRLNGRTKEVDLQVLPLDGPGAEERSFLVLFEEQKAPSQKLVAKMQRGVAKTPKGGSAANRRAILEMKRGLAATKRQLQTITEEAEAANEELQSANEELESRNEELQSANEELETAKEELQSANEELTTLNETLRNRNEELSQINSELERSRAYSESIVATVRHPLLVLDSALRVQKANRAYYNSLQAKPEETVGRLLHDLANGQWDIPALREKLEQILSSGGEFLDFEAHLRFEPIGFRDLVIDARRLEGSREEGPLILFSIVDATAVRRVEQVLKQRADLATSDS